MHKSPTPSCLTPHQSPVVLRLDPPKRWKEMGQKRPGFAPQSRLSSRSCLKFVPVMNIEVLSHGAKTVWASKWFPEVNSKKSSSQPTLNTPTWILSSANSTCTISTSAGDLARKLFFTTSSLCGAERTYFHKLSEKQTRSTPSPPPQNKANYKSRPTPRNCPHRAKRQLSKRSRLFLSSKNYKKWSKTNQLNIMPFKQARQ